MVPFLRAWLRCSASSRRQHPGLATSLCPVAFASSVLLLAALLEASSWHLLLEVHLGSLSLDEEDGLLFLDSSVPNCPPASAPEGQSTLPASGLWARDSQPGPPGKAAV